MAQWSDARQGRKARLGRRRRQRIVALGVKYLMKRGPIRTGSVPCKAPVRLATFWRAGASKLVSWPSDRHAEHVRLRLSRLAARSRSPCFLIIAEHPSRPAARSPGDPAAGGDSSRWPAGRTDLAACTRGARSQQTDQEVGRQGNRHSTIRRHAGGHANPDRSYAGFGPPADNGRPPPQCPARRPAGACGSG